MASISVEIEVVCNECGAQLVATISEGGFMSDLKVRVLPCSVCMKAARTSTTTEATTK